MPIKYDKLFTLLNVKGHSATYWLRSNGISPTIVNKLRKNEQVSTGTLAKLCELLQCQPGDILEYEPDEAKDD